MNEEQASMDFYDGNGKRLLRVDNPPGAIHLQAGHFATKVMRLSRDGVWVNPDIKPDEAAQAVLDALDEQIKVMVQRAVEAEREACAQIAQTPVYGEQDDLTMAAKDRIAAAIRSRT